MPALRGIRMATAFPTDARVTSCASEKGLVSFSAAYHPCRHSTTVACLECVLTSSVLTSRKKIEARSHRSSWQHSVTNSSCALSRPSALRTASTVLCGRWLTFVPWPESEISIFSLYYLRYLVGVDGNVPCTPVFLGLAPNAEIRWRQAPGRHSNFGWGIPAQWHGSPVG